MLTQLKERWDCSLHKFMVLLACQREVLLSESKCAATDRWYAGLWVICGSICYWSLLRNGPSKGFLWPVENKVHLIQCLEEGKLTRFPQTSKARKGLRALQIIVVHVPLYCYCNMPENYDDMIDCDCCKEWLHKSCVCLKGLTRRQVKQLTWLCKICTRESKPSQSTCSPKKPEEFLPKNPAKKHS